MSDEGKAGIERFELLTKRLLAVPKTELDAAREKEKQDPKRKRRR